LAWGLYFLVYAVVGWPSLGGRPPTPFDFFAYITVVPLGIQNYAWIINTLFMAVATTLAIEITFYVFSPWILRSRTLSYLAAAVSLSLIAAAAFKWMPPAVFTYYNSPGPMVFYIMGNFLRRREWVGLLTIAAATVILCAIGAPAMTNIEFIAATFIGVPLVMLAARVNPSKLDEALGNASYGCFVSHSLILFPVMNYLFAVESYATVAVRIIAAIGCACVGYLTFLLVEQPTVAYRRRLRGASDNAASLSVRLPDRETTKSSASANST
jgi:hypothetical protein